MTAWKLFPKKTRIITFRITEEEYNQLKKDREHHEFKFNFRFDKFTDYVRFKLFNEIPHEFINHDDKLMWT